MENVTESLIYIGYSGSVQIDVDTLIVSAWNKYVKSEEDENKIFFNDEKFFENSFKNAYDAAYAASVSDKWKWTDMFVYFDEEGNLTSFSHWDEENSPIDLDKIDIHNLINGLIRCRRTWRQKQK